MAVNLNLPENLWAVEGIRLATTEANIRYKGRNDVLVIELAKETQTAAVFTRNVFCAAPVQLCRQHLKTHNPRYLLINSGNANAGTGKAGLQAAKKSCEIVAKATGCQLEEVLPFSTGVIGELLEAEKFTTAVPNALKQLDKTTWLEAAQAIMTTDTQPKAISKQIELGGKLITITGIAKGAGMIKPDMATLLSYIATDAKIERTLLQTLLEKATRDSFNSISVDGDTSTNDSLVLMATGQSGLVIDHTNQAVFQEILTIVCQQLAHAVIRDAEGATKFVTIKINEANTREEAREVAYTIAHSPLVKTALFASDPNWGRILAAIGRSPVENLKVDDITLWLGDTLLLENGLPAATYREEQGQAEMDKEEITIKVQLGRGTANTTIWTSDLSHEYVTINAEYRS